MSDLVYRNYFFSSQEFAVLSAWAGMDYLHILFEKPLTQLDRKELNQIVFRLYQKGILYWKNEKAYDLKPEIRCLFQDMKLSGKELQVYSRKNKSPLLCFLNDYTVIIELSENDENTIKIHSLTECGFFGELSDRGILPARNSREKGNLIENDFIKDSAQLMQRGCIRYEKLAKLLWESSELSAYITIYDRKAGRDQGVVLILDCGISDGIVFISKELIQTAWYTLDNLKNFLNL